MARWMDANHASSDGLWIKFAKKGSGATSVAYSDALDVALCYGWIDGLKRSFDERWYLLRFTARRPRSQWSLINREKAEALIRAGRMGRAGLAAVEAARGDGRWDAAYPSQCRITVPDDLAVALEQQPAAQRFFESLNSANRYAVLYRLHQARPQATRERVLKRMVAMLTERRTIHKARAGVKKQARRRN